MTRSICTPAATFFLLEEAGKRNEWPITQGCVLDVGKC